MKKVLLFIKLLFSKNKPTIIRFQCSGTLGEIHKFDSLGKIISFDLSKGMIRYKLLIESDGSVSEKNNLLIPLTSLIKIGENTYKYYL